MGLRFFDPKAGLRDGDYPNRVYALVDSVEEIDEETATIVFDCVEADWIDEMSPDAPPFADRVPGTDAGEYPLPDREISIVTIERSDLGISVAQSDWIELALGDVDEDGEVGQSFNLFADPIPRRLNKAEPVTGDTLTKLNHVAGWATVGADTEADIAAELNRRSADALAIYDVGQGAATAFLSGGAPILYFDIGGSAIGNQRSFPAHLTQFCFSFNPPIVLSHWDWDHWSSAMRDPRALTQSWVLPDQRSIGALGTTHATFLAQLKTQARKIMWWPPSLQSVRVSRLDATVHRANGNPKSRNETCLAVLRDRAGGRLARSVFLPGDAPFGAFGHTSILANPIDHVMVPHHGGRAPPTPVPAAQTKTRSHTIYSYGAGNIFMHPLPGTVKSLRPGWKRNAHTALRDDTGFGHVGIDLTGAGKLTTLPCGGNCHLRISNWI